MLSQLLLDVLTEGHKALGLLTHLGVVAAQGDQLFADGASAVGLSLALLGVRDDALHLVTRRGSAVGVAALAGVNEALDAAGDGVLTVVVRVRFTVSIT